MSTTEALDSKPSHFHGQLVQGLLALVVAAAGPCRAGGPPRRSSMKMMAGSLSRH